MAITKDTINYVAHLSRIELRPEEIEIFSHQLQNILDFIDKLSKTDTGNIAPTSHILPIHNVLREDIPQGSLYVEDALKNSPDKKNNFFVVPKIIE